MPLLEAIEARHSVRKYKDGPMAFSGIMAYGSFSGVKNYFVMAGKKGDGLDESFEWA